MALQQSGLLGTRLLGSLLGKAAPCLAASSSSGSKHLSTTQGSHLPSVLGSTDEEKKSNPVGSAMPSFMAPGGSMMMLPARRSSTSLSSRMPAMPFAASQTMAMSTVKQVQSGTIGNSLLLGIYRFWRNQAPFEKPHAAVDSRMLPSLLEVQDQRASVGIWATALFCTIITCNLLGLVPFNEAPTSGLGFATGLGVSVWATATTLGLYKLGFTFPGHFIPGGTPWPMAFIFVPLETISYTFRAVSLGVRLWVNMLAGHTLLHILTGMSLALPFSLPLYTGLPATVAVGTLLSALIGLEYLVAVLQSGVFSILSTVYIGEFNHNHVGAPLAKMVKKH